MKRKVIRIDEEKCNGCGLCIPNCPEGALQIIEGKARLVSDLFCDGLGACIGHCPEGAIAIEEREAEPYDERRVLENIIPQGDAVIRAHLAHLRDHGAAEYLQQALEALREKGIEVEEMESPAEGGHDRLACGCPGTAVQDIQHDDDEDTPAGSRPSRLRHWPVQITLVPPTAPYLRGADLVVAADCTPFAYADFHEDFIRGKVVLVGCPKLDDASYYRDKLTEVFRENDIQSVTAVRMEVPCCSGLVAMLRRAIAASGKDVPLREVVISIRGERLVPAGTQA